MKAKKLKRPGETFSYWGKQSFGGYPGVKHTASEIVRYIPVKPTYVEPFAGLGRTAKLIRNFDRMILNDKSEYALNYLRKNFPNAIITEVDFLDCITEYDDIDTVFFIDPPWKTSVYSENDLTFCDRTDVKYYEQLFDICVKLKGEWIIASDVNGKSGRMMKRKADEMKWHTRVIESRKNVILGQKAKTLLLSKNPFKVHRPKSVGIESFL